MSVIAHHHTLKMGKLRSAIYHHTPKMVLRSAIYHHTLKMVLSGAIFSTLESSKIIHKYKMDTYITLEYPVYGELLFVAQQVFLKDMA